jgi:starch synthase
MHGAMKIVHAASELFPYAKTGGLADAVGSLTATLAGAGHEVMAFLPGYRAVLEHPDAAQAERCLRLKIEMGDQFISGDVRRFSPRPNLTIYLICRDEWFDRRGLYGDGERDYEDNFHRFLFFQKGVIETMRLLALGADILHCHDWQTGLLPLLLRDTEKRFGLTLAVTTVFTIHNIAFQGLFPMRSYHRTNLPDEFRGIDGVEFYGQINMMKGGLLFADRVTTVSPQYAREIQTHRIRLRARRRGSDAGGRSHRPDQRHRHRGVESATDRLLPARYSVADLGGKAACRAELLKLAKLAASPTAPIYGMVCRLAEQKGLDLLLANKIFLPARRTCA